MKTTLFIPKKCKVGFNTRTDTYTGKLGYIIYHDGKTWRKENSWESWREQEATEEDKAETLKYCETNYHSRLPDYHPKIEDFEKLPIYCKGKIGIGVTPIEFDNEPIEGFVLNKKAGGYSSGWNHRQTYCRVYDPRGWEFEISIPNLLYILENTNSIKGKGLDGKFVYSWDGKDLVLVPEESPEYKEMVKFTQIQEIKLKKTDLILGGTYMCKDGTKKTYMGESEEYDSCGFCLGKKLWFYSEGCKYNPHYTGFNTETIDKIKLFESIHPDFANLMEKLEQNSLYKKPNVECIEVKIEDLENKQPNFYSYSYGRSNKCIFYILENKKYKKVEVRLYSKNSNYKHTVEIGRKYFKYASLEEILKNHKLWQLKTTN